MKMKYIKPVILCCYDIDTSIMTVSQLDTETENAADDGGKGSNVSGGGPISPSETKGTSWNLWDDEEEYY